MPRAAFRTTIDLPARVPHILAVFGWVLALALSSASATSHHDGLIAPPPSGVVPLPQAPTEDPDDPLAVPPRAPDGPQFGVADPDVTMSYDIDALPEPVRRMRELIMEAARSGDPERLRPLIGVGDGATMLSFGGPEDDPIAFLKSISGDPEGHELLAIMLDVFEAGYARFEADTENEIFVWPYFYALPLLELTPPQRVELFKLVTAGDYEDMAIYGAYIFFRAGITAEGRWVFFVSGD